MQLSVGLKELKIELTQRCPLACVHCSTNSHRQRISELPLQTVTRILREAGDIGVEKVVFTGGEPLVYPDLDQVIRTATDAGISPTLYTSGIVDDVLSPLTTAHARALTNLGIRRFIFSVYSHERECHEGITRYGTFAPTMHAVSAAANTGVPVEIHFVVMRRNFRHFPHVVEMANRLGASRVSALRFVAQGRGVNLDNREELSPAELMEFAQCVQSCRNDFPALSIRTGSPFNVLRIGHTPCNAAEDVLIINHRGEIFPCDAFKNIRIDEPQFGSVLSNSLQDVWAKSVYLNHVRAILNRHSGDGCQACDAFDGCRSGCLAQKVIHSGWDGIERRDPGCLLQIGPAPKRDMSAVQSIELASTG